MLMAGSYRQNGEEKGDLISAKEETWNHFQHTQQTADWHRQSKGNTIILGLNHLFGC